MSILCTVIRKKIEDQKTTVSEVEREAKIPAGSLRKILVGVTKNPTIETLLAVSRVLKCPVDSIIDDRSAPFKNDLMILNIDLFLECAVFVGSYCKENVQKTIDYDDFLMLVREVYAYSLPQGKLEVRFAEWSLKKISF